MKVLVTGANGQLGRELTLLQQADIKIHGFGRESLDVTDLAQCQSVMAAVRPDAVIHSAADTAVDQAESQPDNAMRINGEGTRNAAHAAKECGAKFVYVSTDYVFDGTADRPYRENDPTAPKSVYGQSKLAGEQYTQEVHDQFFIVRTSWVFGKHGGNFVKTILKLADERDELKVVADQFGSPTYTLDLARFLLELAQTDHYGIYHASNTGTCSWYEFAQAIMEESGKHTRIIPCATTEFPRPAPRPAYSVLAHEAIYRNGLTDLPPWRDALRRFLKEL